MSYSWESMSSMLADAIREGIVKNRVDDRQRYFYETVGRVQINPVDVRMFIEENPGILYIEIQEGVSTPMEAFRLAMNDWLYDDLMEAYREACEEADRLNEIDEHAEDIRLFLAAYCHDPYWDITDDPTYDEMLKEMFDLDDDELEYITETYWPLTSDDWWKIE